MLKSASQRTHPDLSDDPVWDTSREVMTDVFSEDGGYSACEVTGEVTPGTLTTRLPDYRTCNRMPAAGGNCTVTHEYVAGVIKHESGPLNIRSCGEGCRHKPRGGEPGLLPERRRLRRLSRRAAAIATRAG